MGNNKYKTSFTDIILFIKFIGNFRNINTQRLVGNEFRLVNFDHLEIMENRFHVIVSIAHLC